MGEDAVRVEHTREVAWEWLVGMGLLCFPIPTASFFALLGTRRETRKTRGKGQAWPEGRNISH